MTKQELIAFCEDNIRKHSGEVRAFLDLLHAARTLPDDYDTDADPDGAA